ncbi:MAG: tetratricopeptide repeat protein [Fimbriimonas sp.]
MPTELRRFVWPIVVVLAGALLMLVSNQGVVKTPDGLTVIKNTEQYRLALEKARSLSESEFKAAENDDELTQAQLSNLRQAAALFDAMSAFAPEKLGPYAAAGKAYQILDDHDQAIQRLRQCLANRKIDNSEEARLTSVEAHYLLSISYLAKGNYTDALTEATLAVKEIPNAPNYHWGRASCLVQLKRTPEAIKELDAAIALDPNHKRSLALLKMIEPKPKG